MKLTSGSYASAVTTLANGIATINIAAGALPAGSNTLTATYTADTAGSSLLQLGHGRIGGRRRSITLSTITVNESTTLAPVTDQLLGMNLAAWYDV